MEILAVSDVVWQAVIAAFVTLVLAWMQHRAAKKVEQVKLDLKRTSKSTDAKLDEVASQVEEVHKATNSMKDQLVAATEKEAFMRGGVEERQRANAKKED